MALVVEPHPAPFLETEERLPKADAFPVVEIVILSTVEIAPELAFPAIKNPVCGPGVTLPLAALYDDGP